MLRGAQLEFGILLIVLAAPASTSAATSSASGGSGINSSIDPSTPVCERFGTDVFAGPWTRTDASVSVNQVDGWLHIDSDGGDDDSANTITDVSLPATFESRQRLVSGGNNYRTPWTELEYGPSPTDVLYLAYLAGAPWGWVFNTSVVGTDVHTQAPPSEDVWVTIRADIRTDGGDLYAKLDGDGSFTYVLSSTWTIPATILSVTLQQPWDSANDVDYVNLGACASLPSQLCEDFGTDVFSNLWSRNSSSVYVDIAQGTLHTDSSGAFYTRAWTQTNVSLPATFESRQRLVSGGNNYRIPITYFHFGPGPSDFIELRYISDPANGWWFNTTQVGTGIQTKGPPSEDVWTTIRADIRADGGDLYAMFDGEGSFTYVLSSTWSIPATIERITFERPWTSVNDIDYVELGNCGVPPKQLCEEFRADVFSTTWTRTDPSVSVDTADGWLQVASDGGFDDYARTVTNVSLPATFESRQRLVSGGNNYRTPWTELQYGPAPGDILYLGYLAGAPWGWVFNTSVTGTDVHIKAPPSEDVWVTIRADLRVDGGDLYAKLDGEGSFTYVLSSTWSIGGTIRNLTFKQPWDAVVDVDYVGIGICSPAITELPWGLLGSSGPAILLILVGRRFHVFTGSR
jgi:hypothetical protein